MQIATRVTDGARRERHERRETTRKARENGLSRSSDFWASKLKCWQARHVKRDLRVCLNDRGFPTFLFKAQLMRAVHRVSVDYKLLTEQILILAAGLTFRGHEAGLFLLYQ